MAEANQPPPTPLPPIVETIRAGNFNAWTVPTIGNIPSNVTHSSLPYTFLNPSHVNHDFQNLGETAAITGTPEAQIPTLQSYKPERILHQEAIIGAVTQVQIVNGEARGQTYDDNLARTVGTIRDGVPHADVEAYTRRLETFRSDTAAHITEAIHNPSATLTPGEQKALAQVRSQLVQTPSGPIDGETVLKSGRTVNQVIADSATDIVYTERARTEAKKLVQAQIDEKFSDRKITTHDRGEANVALIGGGQASGKGTNVRDIEGRMGTASGGQPQDRVYINGDAYKPLLQGAEHDMNNYQFVKSQLLQPEVGVIRARINSELTSGTRAPNLVIDQVFPDTNAFGLVSSGSKPANLTIVATDAESAVPRSFARGNESTRYENPRGILAVHKNISDKLPGIIADNVGKNVNLEIYDNNTAGQKPRLIMKGDLKNGNIEVLDAEATSRYFAKKDINITAGSPEQVRPAKGNENLDFVREIAAKNPRANISVTVAGTDGKPSTVVDFKDGKFTPREPERFAEIVKADPKKAQVFEEKTPTTPPVVAAKDASEKATTQNQPATDTTKQPQAGAANADTKVPPPNEAVPPPPVTGQGKEAPPPVQTAGKDTPPTQESKSTPPPLPKDNGQTPPPPEQKPPSPPPPPSHEGATPPPPKNDGKGTTILPDEHTRTTAAGTKLNTGFNALNGAAAYNQGMQLYHKGKEDGSYLEQATGATIAAGGAASTIQTFSNVAKTATTATRVAEGAEALQTVSKVTTTLGKITGAAESLGSTVGKVGKAAPIINAAASVLTAGVTVKDERVAMNALEAKGDKAGLREMLSQDFGDKVLDATGSTTLAKNAANAHSFVRNGGDNFTGNLTFGLVDKPVEGVETGIGRIYDTTQKAFHGDVASIAKLTVGAPVYYNAEIAKAVLENTAPGRAVTEAGAAIDSKDTKRLDAVLDSSNANLFVDRTNSRAAVQTTVAATQTVTTLGNTLGTMADSIYSLTPAGTPIHDLKAELGDRTAEFKQQTAATVNSQMTLKDDGKPDLYRGGYKNLGYVARDLRVEKLEAMGVTPKSPNFEEKKAEVDRYLENPENLRKELTARVDRMDKDNGGFTHRLRSNFGFANYNDQQLERARSAVTEFDSSYRGDYEAYQKKQTTAAAPTPIPTPTPAATPTATAPTVAPTPTVTPAATATTVAPTPAVTATRPATVTAAPTPPPVVTTASTTRTPIVVPPVTPPPTPAPISPPASPTARTAAVTPTPAPAATPAPTPTPEPSHATAAKPPKPGATPAPAKPLAANEQPKTNLSEEAQQRIDEAKKKLEHSGTRYAANDKPTPDVPQVRDGVQPARQPGAIIT